MPDKQFKFSEQSQSQHPSYPGENLGCPLRKLHKHEEYIYAYKRNQKPTDVITRCRGCKIWLVVQMTRAPSSYFTNQESWRMTSRVATSQDIEEYTKLGKVRDI